MECLLKQTPVCYPQSSDSVGLGWGPVTWISSKFPAGADAADVETVIANCCSRRSGNREVMTKV